MSSVANFVAAWSGEAELGTSSVSDYGPKESTMNAARSTTNGREARRIKRKSPRFECLEERRLLTLTWNPTKLSLFFTDIGATVTPGGKFFATQAFDIERSLDQGATWKRVTSPSLFAGGAIAYAPSNPNTMLAGSAKGILKSVDGGANWFLLEFNGFGEAKAITFDPKNNNTVFAGMGGVGGGLYKSTDGGAKWSNPLSLKDVRAVAIDPDNPDVVYVGAHAGTLDSGGLLKSTDGGATWTTALENVDVNTVLVNPGSSSHVYAGASDGNIYESQDAGKTWKKVADSPIVAPVTQLSFDPRDSSRLLAATGGQGVFESSDSGSHWTADNQGLTDLNVVAMGIQTASPYMVLAVTYGGNGFWAQLGSGDPTSPPPTSPPTSSPNPLPTPTPNPIPTPVPPQRTGPVLTPAPAPKPVAIPATPLPAPSPFLVAHKKRGHGVVIKHKFHKHPVMTNQKHNVATHGKKSGRHRDVVGLAQVPGRIPHVTVIYRDAEPVT
jgi:photosystem II stability/assembly factor-like uncharacterized protein